MTLKICLAASGGGHFRQLLDLDPAFSDQTCFYITEPTALGVSIKTSRPVFFVPHVALGQARLGSPIAMVFAAVRNAWQSFGIIWRERPDVVLSTGAGSMAFAMLWGRLFGAKIILIDSFARFLAPSAFAKIVSPIAHHRIAQSVGAADGRADIKVFDPFRSLDLPRPEKRALLFATVGATLPFDRLVDYVADATCRGLTPKELVLQVGNGGRQPVGMNAVESLPFTEVKELLQVANVVVCHAGTGSLITALREGCHVITVPRTFALREHYDDHQSEIAEAFSARGLVLVANTQAEFDAALAAIKTRQPVMATTDPKALISHLRALFASISATKRR